MTSVITDAPACEREVLEIGSLYYVLCEQIKYLYNKETLFYPREEGVCSLIDTKEYPFCFVFALLLRTLHELGEFREVEVELKEDIHGAQIEFRGRRGAPRRYLNRLGRMQGIFSSFTKEAGLVCLTAKDRGQVIVQLDTTLYEGTLFVLSAIDTEQIGSALAAVFSFDLTPYK